MARACTLAVMAALVLAVVGGEAEAAKKMRSWRGFEPTSGYGFSSQSHTYATDAWMNRASQSLGGAG